MTAIHRIVPRSMDTQSLLQNSYFIAALVIVSALVILRIVILRLRNQALSDFFHTSGNSYGSHPPHGNHGSMYHGLQLTPLPAAYHPDRRVRAADTDTHGRRLDPTGENWDGKDVLPAYDNLGPPKYVAADWTHGGPSLPMEQSAVTPSPEGEQSGMAHSNTADRAPVDNMDQPFYHTHAMAGVAHGMETLPPPIHHDSSSS